MHTLKIEDLTVKVEDKLILNHFNLTIHSGEIHVIMGPNGTGKSTLSKVIMGDDTYQIISGNIFFDDVCINQYTVDERARMGIFLGMQMPLSMEGITLADFMRTALHEKDGTHFQLMKMIKEIDETCLELKLPKEMVHRSFNQGFSGGERKKNEILQMYLLKPSMILLDEIDSGLDVDSLKIVGESIMKYQKEQECGILLITHYQRLLNYIKPDYVHIMMHGKIIQTKDASLVKEVEEKGYERLEIEASSHE